MAKKNDKDNKQADASKLGGDPAELHPGPYGPDQSPETEGDVPAGGASPLPEKKELKEADKKLEDAKVNRRVVVEGDDLKDIHYEDNPKVSAEHEVARGAAPGSAPGGPSPDQVKANPKDYKLFPVKSDASLAEQEEARRKAEEHNKG
jgi:hypothetical protein